LMQVAHNADTLGRMADAGRDGGDVDPRRRKAGQSLVRTPLFSRIARVWSRVQVGCGAGRGVRAGGGALGGRSWGCFSRRVWRRGGSRCPSNTPVGAGGVSMRWCGMTGRLLCRCRQVAVRGIVVDVLVASMPPTPLISFTFIFRWRARVGAWGCGRAVSADASDSPSSTCS
jgi:hypothetical protein